MELPQSCPFGAQGRKATHDFLSLYTHSSIHHQDPRPTTTTSTAHGHGDFLKTHNFLQPLEREEKNGSKEDNAVDLNVEKAPPPAASPHSVEHTLPGGIGTYSINHISYFNPKPEGSPVFSVARASSNDQNDDNSNCSSYTGSGFTLLDESAARNANSSKENLGDANAVKGPAIRTQWPLGGPSDSSSNHRSKGRSASQPPVQNQGFMEMIKSAKGPQAKEEHDADDFTVTKEGSSSQKGELRVRIDGKCSEQKASTPRSKHSATEQRRRCKINDRFQALRELIPHSDQKRDKASFLLEVIEYIQFLQEKVHKYEGPPYPGWSPEPAKLTPWRNNLRPAEGFADQPRGSNGMTGPVVMFGTKLEEKSNVISPNVSGSPQSIVQPDNGPNFKALGQQSRLTDKALSITPPSQVEILNSMRNGLSVSQPANQPITPDTENTTLPQFQSWKNRTCPSESGVASERLKGRDLGVESGSINISSMYSQGLLNTLTQALQTSGVDLSQASISVQVDIGKRANSGKSTQPMSDKDGEVRSSSHPMVHSRVDNNYEASDQVTKRLRTGKR